MTRRRIAPLAALAALVLAGCQTTPAPPMVTPFFTAPRAFLAGETPHSVAAVDVDDDGRLDLVVAVPDDDGVVVLRGLGGRAFAAPVRYATGTAPKNAIAVDLNGDGVLDLATANQDSVIGQDVSVLLGRAAGGYLPAAHYGACQNPHHLASGDLDGDGAPDLAVACWGQSEVAVLGGVGDGTFAPMTLHFSGANPHTVAIADLDGDGADDLAVANLGASTVGVLLGRGDLTFDPVATVATGSSPHDVNVGDVDGDGLLDLVTANQGSDDVSVLLGAGDGTFAGATFAAGSVPKAVAMADLDGDGAVDLITADTHGNHPSGSTPTTISVLIGDGAGGFAPPVSFPSLLTPFAIDVADLDGDGLLDVVTANWHTDDVVVRYGAGGALIATATRAADPR